MRDQPPVESDSSKSTAKSEANLIPSISLPKGGGAIRGIGEKFGANPVTGTGSVTVPLATSPGRSGFGPELILRYDSGAGNGPFGLGWNLSLPAITRKTEKGLPRYQDAEESDIFILSDAEDLVPATIQTGNDWSPQTFSVQANGIDYTVRRYRPRIEGLFARIERWTDNDTGRICWKSVSKNNVSHLYGLSSEACVTDPEDPSRVFRWLLERSYDDKGNVIAYEYKAEDRVNIPEVGYESNRQSGANKYIKRVHYGNASPYTPESLLPLATNLPVSWFFHVVFDYGEHDLARPRIEEDTTWPTRLDPFSTYRPAFEVRCYRLCRRVLMFHEFAELGSTPCLVRSTDLTFQAGALATVVAAVEQTAYLRNPVDQSYTILDPASQQRLSPKSTPPLEFTYSAAQIDQSVQVLEPDALENTPAGVDAGVYQWLDLDSEGLPGVLTEQGTAWFYRRNVSNLVRDSQGEVLTDNNVAAGSVRASFDPVQCLSSKPSLGAINARRQQFMDLAGEGRQSLVEFGQPVSGFYIRQAEGGWQSFTSFISSPNIDWTNPNLKTIDLDGDGFADILLSEDEVFTWYPSLGKSGFGAAEQVRRPFDDNDGPALVFSDSTQSIYLADLSGDGLTDIVRITNGEVCYWPNRGYGRFGAKISMGNAPWFDSPDQFDQKRIRLADIDGSGATDIIYLGRSQVVLYINQAGNAWSDPQALTEFPAPDDFAAVNVVDLLGNGTACLVWSSPAPGDVGRSMSYIDLMGGQKPHLLVGVKNNLGAETQIQYVASTRFYLQDRLTGTPWLTTLPFPVHVVERVDVYDYVSQSRFTSRYAYHHGYFDGVEREFRGFGMVEQWDSEGFAILSGNPAANIDQATDLPPVLTRTWFHTGVYLDHEKISLQYSDGYYREPGLNAAALDAMLLPDTLLPSGITLSDGTFVPWMLSADEEREACRSLKGAILRQEIYAQDGTLSESRPYSVSERNYTIQLCQPTGENRSAVFFTYGRETINYHYERQLYDVGGQSLADPRVSHTMTLSADAYGNVLKAASIGYGRRHDASDSILTPADRTQQKRFHATMTESVYTHAILLSDQYLTPATAETRTYELLNITPQANLPLTTNLFRFEEVATLALAAGDGLHDVPYEDIDGAMVQGSAPYRRLIECARVLYRKDDLSGPLPLGEWESLALPYESYKLAITPGSLTILGAKLSLTDATALLLTEGQYRDLDQDGRLWIPTGRIFFSGDPAIPDQIYARSHYYLPQGSQDPWGNISRLVYDPYDLLPVRVDDSLGNTVSAVHDYRLLQPQGVTDPNGNRTVAAFDILGGVAGTAVMGKHNESLGDSLQGFVSGLTDAAIAQFFADPHGQAEGLLGTATSRVVYDLDSFRKSGQPIRSAMLVREKHLSDLQPAEHSPIQVSVSYSDGFGREMQKKVQAEAGPLESGGATIDPRWVGTGWTIFNNKGKPVKQYEPFFCASSDFEFAIQRGVSPTLFYDPLSRNVATLYPNGSYGKSSFDPWRQKSWDGNDTILLNPKTDPDTSSFFSRLPDIDYLPTWHDRRIGGGLGAQEQQAAAKTELHANTPTVVHFDALGRTFLTVADNGPAGQYTTRVKLDIEGNQRAVTDARDRVVQLCDYTVLGSCIHQVNMEAGERWTLNDITGKPIRSWDQRGHVSRLEYDGLRRLTRAFVRGTDAARSDPRTLNQEMLVLYTEYGEGQPDDQASNLRTRIFRLSDGAGVVTHLAQNVLTNQNEAYDFKGNALRSSRQLVQDYKSIPDWSGSPLLEPLAFISATTYDALNRVMTLTLPDKSLVRPGYNEANLMETMEVNLRGASDPTPFVTNIDYDAKGQRVSIEYGNQVRTDYGYDPETFRLAHLLTTRRAADFPDDDVTPPNPPRGVQNLSYTYDPTGNVTTIQDDAQQTIYFNNQVVEPRGDYTYDALYRLIASAGREHIGQVARPEATWSDEFRINLPHPNDGQAMRGYSEQYVYDEVGNFLQLIHQAANGNWTRDYSYIESSLIEPAKMSNRLSSTGVGPNTDHYSHDVHGNMTAMPQLGAMTWDFKDHFQSADLSGGGEAFYIYDASGQRVRKVIERQNGTRQKERLYLGGFEIYREYDGPGLVVTLERETLQVMDDVQRIALVETRTAGTDDLPPQTVRYQFSNHLGSASLELDSIGQIISYEEYYPYGSTSYQAGRSVAETSLKRYRYTGKERDEESGLNYHGARYYAPWLGRWTATDPIGLQAGVNLYLYCRDCPLMFSDPSGTEEVKPRSLSIDIGSQHIEVKLEEKSQGQKKGPSVGGIAVSPNGPLGRAIKLGGLEQELAAAEKKLELLQEANEIKKRPWQDDHKDPRPQRIEQGSPVRSARSESYENYMKARSIDADMNQNSISTPFYGLLMANRYKMDDEQLIVANQRAQDVSAFAAGAVGSQTEYETEGPAPTTQTMEPPPDAFGANSSMQARQLARQLTSEEQTGQAMWGIGTPIAGAGARTALHDAPRLVAQYGGDAADWAKMSTENSSVHGVQTPDGTNFEVHWYQNSKTGRIAELKTKVANE